MKKYILITIILLSLASFAYADEPNFDVNPGLTPDSPFYFIDEFFEGTPDNPQEAQEFREEKIAEALAMAREGKKEYAKIALKRAGEYGDILEKEITPEMEDRIKKRKSETHDVFSYISEEIPELKEETLKQISQDEKISLAAEVSGKIQTLCNSLSKLDPKQYAETCKSNDDSPQWLKKQHEDLSQDQKEHAKIFAKKLQQCMNSPKDCDCEGMGVKSFESICKQESTKMAACRSGDQEACSSTSKDFNPADYLPDYLIDVMFDMMENDRNEDDQDPKEDDFCGEGDDQAECRSQEFKKKAPQECLDAGLTGSSTEDFKKCREIFEKNNKEKEEKNDEDKNQDNPYKCMDVEDKAEKLKCFEKMFGGFKEEYGDDFDNSFEHDSEEFKKELMEKREEFPNQFPSSGKAIDVPDNSDDKYNEKYTEFPGDITEEGRDSNQNVPQLPDSYTEDMKREYEEKYGQYPQDNYKDDSSSEYSDGEYQDDYSDEPPKNDEQYSEQDQKGEEQDTSEEASKEE
ncbi:hypothetical protein HQ489_03595 [Candidatus Woesearchaeota archaeon]|nr:hypothetical protein [Candidatus Woesearchaeota archaeon]